MILPQIKINNQNIKEDNIISNQITNIKTLTNLNSLYTTSNKINEDKKYYNDLLVKTQSEVIIQKSKTVNKYIEPKNKVLDVEHSNHRITPNNPPLKKIQKMNLFKKINSSTHLNFFSNGSINNEIESKVGKDKDHHFIKNNNKFIAYPDSTNKKKEIRNSKFNNYVNINPLIDIKENNNNIGLNISPNNSFINEKEEKKKEYLEFSTRNGFIIKKINEEEYFTENKKLEENINSPIENKILNDGKKKFDIINIMIFIELNK